MDTITDWIKNLVTMQQLVTVVVAIVIAPIVGGIMMGIDRKITARIQGRIGPPIFQPIYDLIKLLCKQPLALNSFQIMYAYLHLAFMILVLVLLALGQDMLMVLFAHAFSSIALILGGMCVRSPYSRIGSQRKIMQMLAYEPILILLVVGIYLSNGSFMAMDVVKDNASPLLPSMPLLLLSFVLAIAIKLDKSPFDVATSHHAHQELVKGVTLEYTGPYLAIVELTHFYETFILFVVVAMFWSTNPFIGSTIASACFLAMIVLDNAFARLTTMWMVRFMWTIPMVLAVANIIWLYMGKMGK